ncbi:MAG: carbohydrate kinase family protein [Patescibacteria group bacterium]|nr:carbohydrate kinase family protein [Patescibacteria group bacterium]
MSNPSYDFLAIGDITIDAFIKLATGSARILHGPRGKEEICMNFGDKIPYEEVEVIYAVGNSPNASVAAARLGLRSAIVTNLGQDENGDRCLAALEKNGVATEYVKRHKDILTNYHYVLRYEEERTILIKHEHYPYALPDLPPPRWLYLSSLGENSLEHHHEIAGYLERNKDVKFTLQPGTFQIRLGCEQLRDLFRRTELFFCNKQEAQRILGLGSEENMHALLAALRERGPKIPIITDGPRGAYALESERVLRVPMYPDPKPPVDRTGAGDSFSATVTTALALGLDLPEALRWGPVNSMSVVQKVGAQAGLLTRDELERYLADAPSDYHVSEETLTA